MSIDTDSIKRHFNIVDIARQLNIEIINNNKCRCIHGKEDKNASMSFYINNKGFYAYKCFSCGEHGSSIDLVKYVLNYDFVKACEYIDPTCKSSNTTYSRNNGTYKASTINNTCRSESNAIKQTESIKQVSSTNINIYTDFINLLDDTEAIEYLNARKITDKITKQYRIKNLPKDYNKQTEITKQLQSKYTDNELIDSGLFIKEKYNNGIYNHFSNNYYSNHRLIFSFIENNKILGLQARHIDNNPEYEKKKYLYTKKTDTNNHNRIFNIELLDSLKKGSYILICEGIIDCLSWQRLTYNCIAIGSSSNVEKLNDSTILKKLAKYKIRLVGDNDNSGEGMNNNIKKLLDKHCIQTKIIDLQSVAKAHYITEKIKDVNDIIVNMKLTSVYSESLGSLYFCEYENNQILFLDYGTFDYNELDNLDKNNIETFLKFKKAFDNDVKVIGVDTKILNEVKKDYTNIKHKELV